MFIVKPLNQFVIQFEMTDNLWRWEHRNYGVPERHGETIDETIVNGQSFLSTWPFSLPDNGNPSYTSSPPGFSDYNYVIGLSSIQNIFGQDVQVYLEKLSGRGTVELSQAPDSANNHTFRVFLDDDNFSSHDFYHFKIYGSGSETAPIPEPSTIFLSGIGLIGFFLIRQSKCNAF